MTTVDKGSDFRDLVVRKGFTQEDLTELHLQLTRILDAAILIPDQLANTGICFNLLDLMKLSGDYPYRKLAFSVSAIMCACAATWQHPNRNQHSNASPIGHDYSFKYWEGPNLAQRISLLEHMREIVFAEIQRMSEALADEVCK